MVVQGNKKKVIPLIQKISNEIEICNGIRNNFLERPLNCNSKYEKEEAITKYSNTTNHLEATIKGPGRKKETVCKRPEKIGRIEMKS